MSRQILKLNSELRMQPSFVFRYLKAVESKIGKRALFNDGKYKRYKELFLGAVLAQTFSESMEVNFFVQSPDEDPPDFSLRHWIKVSPDSDKTTEGILNYEVVDYTGHSSGIHEVIDKKLSQAYPEDYGVVVFFRHPTETTIDHDNLVERYKHEKRWIIFITRVTETKSGIKLLQEKWLVAGLTKPNFQKIIDPSIIDKPNLPQVWRQSKRGRDMPVVEVDFGLELPN